MNLRDLDTAAAAVFNTAGGGKGEGRGGVRNYNTALCHIYVPHDIGPECRGAQYNGSFITL